VVDALANLAWQAGRFGEARRAHERSFIIRVRELGPEHPDTLDSASALQGMLGAMAARDAAAEAEGASLYMAIHALGGLEPDPRALGTPMSREEAAEHFRRYAATVAGRIAADPFRPGSVRARIRDWWNRVPPRN
jgi:hypothetical protein